MQSLYSKRILVNKLLRGSKYDRKSSVTANQRFTHEACSYGQNIIWGQQYYWSVTAAYSCGSLVIADLFIYFLISFLLSEMKTDIAVKFSSRKLLWAEEDATVIDIDLNYMFHYYFHELILTLEGNLGQGFDNQRKHEKTRSIKTCSIFREAPGNYKKHESFFFQA